MCVELGVFLKLINVILKYLSPLLLKVRLVEEASITQQLSSLQFRSVSGTIHEAAASYKPLNDLMGTTSTVPLPHHGLKHPGGYPPQ